MDFRDKMKCAKGPGFRNETLDALMLFTWNATLNGIERATREAFRSAETYVIGLFYFPLKPCFTLHRVAPV